MSKEKIIFIIFSLLLIFEVLCSGKSKIEMMEKSYDFGDVSPKKELKHIFLFKNKGDSALKIIKIKAG